MASKRILITGASGLLGSRLTQMLQQKGYEVAHLSRGTKGTVPTFQWDVKRGLLDEKALQGVSAIIHLAGAGVADKRWTKDRKKEILESRTESTKLLFDRLKSTPNEVRTFLSASAIGYYGFNDGEKVFKESDPNSNDFLATVTAAWEHEVKKMTALGIREARLRIGVVLAKDGGALQPIAKTIRNYVGSPLGSGEQFVSWVHIDDVCGLFIHALENENISGPLNAVSENPVTNKALTKAIADHLNKPVLLPAVPEFVLNIVLGEMATIVTKGSRVSPQKVIDSGYVFKYKKLDAALNDLL